MPRLNMMLPKIADKKDLEEKDQIVKQSVQDFQKAKDVGRAGAKAGKIAGEAAKPTINPIIKETKKQIQKGNMQKALQAPLTKSEKKQAIKTLDDPKKLAALGDKLQQGKAPTKTSDLFVSAAIQLAPLIIGGIFEGSEGAIMAHQGAQQMTETLQARDLAEREMQVKEMALEAKLQPKQLDPMEVARLEVAKSNLGMRQLELQQRIAQAGNLKEERALKRDERELQRAITAKNTFSARADVKKFKETIDDIDAIETLVLEGGKLPGALNSRVARTVAGEVGVLTNQDIARSQINPEIITSIHRQLKRWTVGELPEKDKQEIVKIARAIIAKKRVGLAEKATQFAASRGKHLAPEFQSELAEDLFTEHGLHEALAAAQPMAPAPAQPAPQHPKAGMIFRHKATGKTMKVLADGSLQEL